MKKTLFITMLALCSSISAYCQEGGNGSPGQTEVQPGGITAYRPQGRIDGDNIYYPFTRVAVGSSEQTDSNKGPGIRINIEDKSRNLIEVEIVRNSESDLLTLHRGNTSNIRLWTSRNKDQEITFPYNNGLDTDALPFETGANQLVIWAEWSNSSHGTENVVLKPLNNPSMEIGSITIHTFHSLVVAIAGWTQSSASDCGTGKAATFLRGLGYDADWYRENDEHNLIDSHKSIDEMVDAVNNRYVSNITTCGYSLGCWKTRICAESDSIRDLTFSYVGSNYVDGIRIEFLTPWAESRKPHGSVAHTSQYQKVDESFCGFRGVRGTATVDDLEGVTPNNIDRSSMMVSSFTDSNGHVNIPDEWAVHKRMDRDNATSGAVIRSHYQDVVQSYLNNIR